MAIFVNRLAQNQHFYRGPSIDASYQVSIHLAKQFKKRNFLEIDQSKTRIAYGGHVLTDRDEMSNLYRGPSTKFQFIWPSGFKGEDFLEIDQSETRIALVW